MRFKWRVLARVKTNFPSFAAIPTATAKAEIARITILDCSKKSQERQRAEESIGFFAGNYAGDRRSWSFNSALEVILRSWRNNPDGM